jgi:hypothetical protein
MDFCTLYEVVARAVKPINEPISTRRKCNMKQELYHLKNWLIGRGMCTIFEWHTDSRR